MSGSATAAVAWCSALGEHTAEVLAEAGLAKDEIAALTKAAKG
jgi:crotonobetainyl-CoA:carnitine CoA-transferase CaiB-like acyl-CoA transferase